MASIETSFTKKWFLRTFFSQRGIFRFQLFKSFCPFEVLSLSLRLERRDEAVEDDGLQLAEERRLAAGVVLV